MLAIVAIFKCTRMLSFQPAEKLATSVVAQTKQKLGFVYVGPVADAGWTYEHDRGRLAVEKEHGDKVETVFVESVSEGPDAGAGNRSNGSGRCRFNFHDLVRIHESNDQSGAAIP